MIGIIVCTHSNLAQGLRDAVEMVTGEQSDLDVVGFFPGDDMLELSEGLKVIARSYRDRGQPYLFAVDLYGATPFNSSAVALAEVDACVLTGVNLPMLLELVTQRTACEEPEELADMALASAKIGTRAVRMRDMFKNRKDD